MRLKYVNFSCICRHQVGCCSFGTVGRKYLNYCQWDGCLFWGKQNVSGRYGLTSGSCHSEWRILLDTIINGYRAMGRESKDISNKTFKYILKDISLNARTYNTHCVHKQDISCAPTEDEVWWSQWPILRAPSISSATGKVLIQALRHVKLKADILYICCCIESPEYVKWSTTVTYHFLSQ